MHLLAERFVFLGLMIGVFWTRESRPIKSKWHQCRLSTRQVFFCLHMCSLWFHLWLADNRASTSSWTQAWSTTTRSWELIWSPREADSTNFSVFIFCNHIVQYRIGLNMVLLVTEHGFWCRSTGRSGQANVGSGADARLAEKLVHLGPVSGADVPQGLKQHGSGRFGHCLLPPRGHPDHGSQDQASPVQSEMILQFS